MNRFSYKPVLTDEYFEGKPLVIDHTPQMLFGDAMVEDFYRVHHEQQTPEKYAGNPVFRASLPCEQGNIMRPSVIYDDEIGRYRMWYSAGGEHDICYAESDDGLTWEKPILNLVRTDVFGDNNIVEFTDEYIRGQLKHYEHEIGQVILNPDRSDRSKKFIMVYNNGTTKIAYSADGIRWTPEEAGPAGIAVDCSLNLAYDESREMWQLFTRPSMHAKDERLDVEKTFYPNGNYRRRVCVLESPDLKKWSAPRVVYRPADNFPRQQADNIHFFSVGNYPMAFIQCFAAYNNDGCKYQRVLPYLATGRDVYHLRPLTENKPIVDYGKYPSYDDQRIIIDDYPHELMGDGRTYFYYRGYHHDIVGNNEITVNLLSFDGNRFCARAADEHGGWLVTREFILDGSEIEIDADIPDVNHGYIKAELVDGGGGRWRDGLSIDGFRYKEADAITGNGKHLTLTWQGNSDVSSLKGRAVYLRFHLVGAKLYSFTVKE